MECGEMEMEREKEKGRGRESGRVCVREWGYVGIASESESESKRVSQSIRFSCGHSTLSPTAPLHSCNC